VTAIAASVTAAEFLYYNDDLIKPVYTVAAAAATTPADRENMRAGGPH